MRKVHIDARPKPLAWQLETRLALQNRSRANSSARWYDPEVGRWLSEDPISFTAGDANLYRYVGNNVVTVTDPNGLVANQAGATDPQSFLDKITQLENEGLDTDQVLARDYKRI